MKIRKIALLLSFIMCLTSLTSYAKTIEFTIGNKEASLKDAVIETFTLPTEPIIENSRTLVGVRVISEKFGADVKWIEEEKKVLIKDDAKTIELTIGSEDAYINGVLYKLDCAPVIKDGSTLVPLRFVSEALDKYVEFVDSSSQIIITDETPICKIGNAYIGAEDLFNYCILYGIDPSSQNLEQIMSTIYQIAVVNTYISQYMISQGKYLDQSQKDELKLTIESNIDAIEGITLDAFLYKALGNNLYSVTLENECMSRVNDAITITDFYNKNFVRAKHILIPTVDMETGEEFNRKEKQTAYSQAEKILKRVKAGDDFDLLVQKYSQDPGSISNPDGYVFTRGEMVKEFEETAFTLEVGEISDIVETSYGYHIIKKEELGKIDDYLYSLINDEINTYYFDTLYDEIINSTKAQLYIDANELTIEYLCKKVREAITQ